MNFYFLLQIRKVLNITLSWMFISIVFTICVYGVIYYNYGASESLEKEFWLSIRTDVVATFVAGILGGSMLVFVIGKYFKSKPYWYSMLMSLILFLIVFVITYTTAATFYESQRMPEDVSLTELFGKVLFRFTHLSILSSMLFWGLVVMGTQFMLQISDKFGPGVLWKFITGKYSNPKSEQRIFMFLDIRSSTSIAEKLGSQRYFDLLKDFFADITLDILESRGEIYQYVGDEIVISWPMNEGLRHRNCLRCFFRIKQTIQKQSEKYMNQYDLVPDFKAGLHLGDITAGEIGVIKREIVYSGDTLNTAARIQGMCNHHQTDLLISKPLYDSLQLDHTLFARALGEIELRGKKEKMVLLSVQDF